MQIFMYFILPVDFSYIHDEVIRNWQSRESFLMIDYTINSYDYWFMGLFHLIEETNKKSNQCRFHDLPKPFIVLSLTFNDL
jgi:hypothetical protein